MYRLNLATPSEWPDLGSPCVCPQQTSTLDTVERRTSRRTQKWSVTVQSTEYTVTPKESAEAKGTPTPVEV